MMEVSSISENLLFSTIRIVAHKAEDTTLEKPSIGTAFVFGHTHQGKTVPFLITNKHVIKDSQKGLLTFTQQANDGTPLLGTPYTIPIDNFERAWYGHPDPTIDVAVMLVAPLNKFAEVDGVKLFYRIIDSEILPTEEELKELDALEEVLFIGYPNGIWDHINLLPIMRKGITATPITIDFQGKKQFLIDASVFPGSSGSPVFLYNNGVYREKTGDFILGIRLKFVGIIASVKIQIDKNKVEMLSIPTAVVPGVLTKETIDLGVVFKASTIIETTSAYLKEKFGQSIE